MESIFEDYLSKDEKVLWTGQPEKFLIFDRRELYYLPISIVTFFFNLGSLFIFVISMLNIILDMDKSLTGNQGINTLIMILSFIISIILFYVSIGRFFYKNWKIKKTYYAVTDSRIIVLIDTWKRRLEEINLNKVDGLSKIVYSNEKGTIRFESSEFADVDLWSLYIYTGFDLLYKFTQGYSVENYSIVFYNIKRTEEVWNIIQEITFKI